MSAEAPSLVCNLKDVVLVPMPGRHSGTRIGLAVFRGHEFPYSIDCAVRVVPPGGRAPLLDVTHWAEELGFVVAGSGEYHAADEVFPVCGGDFLLAPESTMGRNFEVVNTGTEQMVFIAFKSQRHVLNRKRQDHARAVIDQFLLRRQETSMGRAADYTFDGRILTVSHPVLRGSCTMVITFDQFGTVWINGEPLREAPGENIDALAERLMKVEQGLLAEAYWKPL